MEYKHKLQQWKDFCIDYGEYINFWRRLLWEIQHTHLELLFVRPFRSPAVPSIASLVVLSDLLYLIFGLLIF